MIRLRKKMKKSHGHVCNARKSDHKNITLEASTKRRIHQKRQKGKLWIMTNRNLQRQENHHDLRQLLLLRVLIAGKEVEVNRTVVNVTRKVEALTLCGRKTWTTSSWFLTNWRRKIPRVLAAIVECLRSHGKHLHLHHLPLAVHGIITTISTI